MSAFSPASPAAHFQIVSIGKTLGPRDFHLDFWFLGFKDEANSLDLIQASGEAVLSMRLESDPPSHSRTA